MNCIPATGRKRPIDAHAVQPYYTLLLAREAGMTISIRAAADEIVLYGRLNTGRRSGMRTNALAFPENFMLPAFGCLE